jgi:hypothetical protein
MKLFIVVYHLNESLELILLEETENMEEEDNKSNTYENNFEDNNNTTQSEYLEFCNSYFQNQDKFGIGSDGYDDEESAGF